MQNNLPPLCDAERRFFVCSAPTGPGLQISGLRRFRCIVRPFRRRTAIRLFRRSAAGDGHGAVGVKAVAVRRIGADRAAGDIHGEIKAGQVGIGRVQAVIRGTDAEDRENFILLLAELRAAMDSAFGPGRKSLTACASGAPVEPERPTWDTLAQEDLLELLQTPGWHSAYDARADSAYLVYDGPDNPFDRWFLSVETARSLGQKLDLIRNAELAGIIVWEASLDTKNHSFAAQLRDTLLR